MKIIAWNCQGLAKPKAIRALRSLLKETKPDAIFLSEVKIPFSISISKALDAHSLSNVSSVPPIGLAGGLILAWSNTISLDVIVQNNLFIHSSITSDPNKPPWSLTCVYCPCYPNGKAHFWDSIHQLASNLTEPWILIGDFNSVTSQSEKIGGLPVASSSTHNLSNEQ